LSLNPLFLPMDPAISAFEKAMAREKVDRFAAKGC
jgi:hypothetical protein